MSVYGELFSYLNTQWNDRTKIVFPNITVSQISGSYTDTKTVLDVIVLDIGTRTLDLPVVGGATMEQSFILQCNIVCEKNEGFSVAYGHADFLDSTFRNQTFTQGGVKFHFEESRRRAPVPDPLAFVIPWECPFFVYLNN